MPICHETCIKSVRIWSYLVWMWENADQNNSEYGHFLLSGNRQIYNWTPNILKNVTLKSLLLKISEIRIGLKIVRRIWGNFEKLPLYLNHKIVFVKPVLTNIISQPIFFTKLRSFRRYTSMILVKRVGDQDGHKLHDQLHIGTSAGKMARRQQPS